MSGAVVVVVALVGVVVWFATRHAAPPPACAATADGQTYVLDPEQAENAATIAAVGKRLGMPDHAVTVALAAALQESKLRNVEYGDRDSLGLFQQRPSQGWGSAAQVRQPAYAAQVFFQHLARVPGWSTLPIADAAQAVQHSAGGYAYAQWEPQARGIARVLTGEVPAALICRFPTPKSTTSPPPDAALLDEAGTPTVHVPVPATRGWVVASWLVAHAYDYGIIEVDFNGRAWTNSSGRWRTTGRGGSWVGYRRVPRASS